MPNQQPMVLEGETRNSLLFSEICVFKRLKCLGVEDLSFLRESEMAVPTCEQRDTQHAFYHFDLLMHSRRCQSYLASCRI